MSLPPWVEPERAYDFDDVVRATTTAQPLFRSRATQEAYRSHMERLRSEWRSVEDFLQHRVFKCAVVTLDDGRLAAAPLSDEDRLGFVVDGHCVRFCHNDFPYDLNGVEHFVLWSRDGPLDAATIEALLDHFIADKSRARAWYLNPPQMRSVTGLFHVQVYVVVSAFAPAEP